MGGRAGGEGRHLVYAHMLHLINSPCPRDWTIYSVEYVLFTLAASSAYLRLRPTIIHSLADTNAPTPTVLYSLSFLSSLLDYYWYSLDYRSIINHDDDSNP